MTALPILWPVDRVGTLGGQRWLVPLGFVVASTLVLWATHDVLGDDPHITFTYSRNLADGHGFVFNIGDRTLSTTTPLTALVMTIPSGLGLDVALSGIVTSVLAAIAIGVVLYLNLRPLVGGLAAVSGALLAILHPFAITTVSNEMLPYVALALWSMHWAVRGRSILAMVVVALCTLTRPDGVIALGIVVAILGYRLWRRHQRGEASTLRSEIVRPMAAAAFVLGPWLVFATLYFGSPVPVTLRAKRNQRDAGLGGGFVSMLRERFDELLDGRGYVVAAVVGAVGLLAAGWVLLVDRRDQRSGEAADLWLPESATIAVFLGWNTLYALGYIVVGVTAYSWYASPLIVSMAILTGFAVMGLQRLITVLTRSSVAGTIAGAGAGLVMLAPLAVDVVEYRDRPPYRADLYPDVGRWLATHVPPDSTVGTLEVGIIGYNAHRTIIDFAGLIQPEVADSADPSLGFDGLALEAWHRFQPEFVAMLRPGLAPLMADADFQSRCSVVATFEQPDLADVMDIYDCRTSQ